MAIIKAPPKQPKTVTIQARVEESVKAQLDRYAEFIDSSTSRMIPALENMLRIIKFNTTRTAIENQLAALRAKN